MIELINKACKRLVCRAAAYLNQDYLNVKKGVGKTMWIKLTKKNSKIIIRIVAIVEICIGLLISLSFMIPSLINPPGRPKAVYVFVILTSLISVIIGIGLFRYKRWGRQLLVFFAGYVIVTKFILLSNLAEFTGNTIEFMSINSKDTLSLIYHGIILIIFNLKDVKKALE